MKYLLSLIVESLWFVAMASVLAAGCAREAPPPNSELDDRPPQLLEAFFGLDNALPAGARWICSEAPGADGMPVTFSRRVLGSGPRGADVDAAAFTVTTRSGALKTPDCATLRPAVATSEGHTVLLIGDFGDAADDPPVRVEVTGSVTLAGEADGHGLEVEVTELDEGPTIVLALAFAPGSIESDCPESSKQVVMVVWAGGVTPGPGQTDESHLGIYSLATESGSSRPFGLADLGDNDNYVHLCLDTDSRVNRVTATAGVLVDPRGDLNPETSLEVVR